MNKFKFDKNTTSLFETILGLKNVKEAERFFRDLCTIDELKSMSERWQVAKLISQGVSYRETAAIVGASTTTVTRVANWLNNGEGGYQLALSNLNSHHNSSKISEKG